MYHRFLLEIVVVENVYFLLTLFYLVKLVVYVCLSLPDFFDRLQVGSVLFFETLVQKLRKVLFLFQIVNTRVCINWNFYF